MRKGRYPLEQVLQERGRACQAAELELARARGRLHDAQLALAQEKAAHEAHSHKRTQVVALGQLSSQQLAWSGAYAARLQADGLKLFARVQAAQSVVTAEARAVRLAELTWQRAYVERETLERHHERFREAERKAADRAAELEAEELHPAYRPQLRT